MNRDPEFECQCRAGFTGRRCGGKAEQQVLRLSMGALAAILVCLLIILSESDEGVDTQTFFVRDVLAAFSCLCGSDVGRTHGECP